MSVIRWLHISDLHYGYENYNVTEMRSGMLDALPKNILDKLAPPEYLFITGDLRYGKNCGHEFPKEIVQNIKKLMESFAIPPERTHIVMGNHDVVHELGRKDIAPLLRDEYYKNGNLDSERMNSLEQSQHKFYEIYNEICGRKPSPYHYYCPENDFNIIGLNTAFSCSDNSEDGNLIVGMQLVQKTLDRIDSSKPGIVLAHHGFESLQHREREQLEIKLKDSGAILYLCGHEHLADCRIIATRRENQPLFEYICGTGMDKLPNGQPSEMVVFMGELDTIQRNGHICALEWSKRSEAWFPYADMSFKQTGLSDGIHYFPSKPIQEIISPKVKEDALERYRKYLLYECGEIRLDGMPADDKVGSKTLELEKLYIPTNLSVRKSRNRDDFGFGFDFDSESEIYQIAKEASKGDKPLSAQFFNEMLTKIENEALNENSEEELVDLKNILEKDYFKSLNIELSQEEIASVQYQMKVLNDKLLDRHSLIPLNQTGFRRVVLAGPGGGKTTLLKRLVTAYAFPERREDSQINDNLPNRELFPIWIRCRDLKDSANLSISEILKDIPLKADCHVEQKLTTALIAEIFGRINRGDALILFDGLDEISDTGLRKIFADKIARFAQLNPMANIIVTSRIAGFEHISGGKLGEFLTLEISHLDEKDIRLLCKRWHKIIYDDREETLRQADLLADTIINHEKIYALAKSPLLLTTLLLVRRRVGRLPTKRVALYEESVRVLLETWNQEGFERIELDTAKCQLSYIAFEMIRKGMQTIGRRDIETLLINVRKELTWLPSGLESPGKFLERVELRSSLLTKRGYRAAEGNVHEEEFEFQHLTFQEYLAAYAAVSGYYADADKQDEYIDSLDNFYGDGNKEEILLLAAAQMKRNEVTQMVTVIIKKIGAFDLNKNVASKIIALRRLLSNILLDEVQLVEGTRKQIYAAIIEDTIYYGQIPLIQSILKSNLGEEFKLYLEKNGQGSLLAAFEIQDKEDDPIEKCFNMIEKAESNTDDRLNALKTFSDLIWVSENTVIKKRIEEGLGYSVFSVLFEILMQAENGKEALAAAGCLNQLVNSGGETPLYNIPDGFVWRLINLYFEQGSIGNSIRLVSNLPLNEENIVKFICPDCPDKIKQFLIDNIDKVNYNQKEGLYLAITLVGTWTLDEAADVLNTMFSEADEDKRKKINDKLCIIKTASLGENISLSSQGDE